MRLIDADELKEWITGHCDIELDEATEGEILRVIDDQLTAFNMDNIVESLYEIRNELLHNTGYDSEIINWCLDWFDMAIDIVKGAVKDE